MEFIDKVQDTVERAQRVEAWPGRFKVLLDEKKKTKKTFCEDHGICAVQLSRYCKGRHVPTWTRIDEIESALEKEGA